MSIQAERDELAIISVTEPGTCVQPALIGEPIDEASAARMAQVFKALVDPDRLRLLSLIGARQGGEVWRFDLAALFHPTHPPNIHRLPGRPGPVDLCREGHSTQVQD